MDAGGEHRARIVRGGSYVDSIDGGFNHAATLGARATLHSTTSAGNVGFRCAKSPRRRTEYRYVYEDEEGARGTLAVEDEFGRRRGKETFPGRRGRDDRFVAAEEDDDDDDEGDDDDDDEFTGEGGRRKKRKVVKPRTRISNEL